MTRNSDPAISRRKFGRRAALMAAVPALAPASFAAQDQPAAGAGLSPEENSEIEARYNNVIRVYGGRLSDDQKEHIRRILTTNERMLSRIRQYPLDNGDSPASVLKVTAPGVSKGGK
jgi:hypothetical protein